MCKRESEVIRNENQKIPYGIWTPSAQVLCYDCHGRKFVGVDFNPESEKFENRILSEEDFNKAKEEVELEGGNEITQCVKCGAFIQLEQATAKENNLSLKLKSKGVNAYMSQTGGMNSAVEIRKEDGGFVWVTYGLCDDGEWYLGSYDEEGEYDDYYYLTNDEEDMINHIVNLKGLK